MSLFLTYARHGIVMKPEDYLCIDEAHELAKWASNCFEDCLPRALEVKEMNEFLVRCGSMSPFSVNHIRQYDFPSHDSLPFRHAKGDYIKRIKIRLYFMELKILKKKHFLLQRSTFNYMMTLLRILLTAIYRLSLLT